MSDLFLELSRNPTSRNLIKGLKMPVPLPPILERSGGPVKKRPLLGHKVGVFCEDDSKVMNTVEETLIDAGARCFFNAPDLSGETFHSLVFDATTIRDIDSLKKLHRFFHSVVRQVRTCGRIVVIGNIPSEEETAQAAAAQRGLEGFVRSLSKELGKKGITVQLLKVQESAERRLAGPLRFFLSPASAYITGQPFEVTHTCAPIEGEHDWELALQGKVVLVTGAAQGIGAQSARILSKEGAKVVILDRPEAKDQAEKLASEIVGSTFYIDITHKEAPDKITKFLNENFGGVDVVVHNAGITRDKTLGRMSDALWDMTLDVNLGAIARVTDRLLESKTLKSGGRIICLSSIAGIAGNMGQTNYATSKAGVIGYVQFMANKLASEGITVNAVAPGFIETQMTAVIPFAIRQVGRRLNNLSQGGLPEDVGQALTFFATPGSQGLTGQVMRVCGGSLLGA